MLLPGVTKLQAAAPDSSPRFWCWMLDLVMGGKPQSVGPEMLALLLSLGFFVLFFVLRVVAAHLERVGNFRSKSRMCFALESLRISRLHGIASGSRRVVCDSADLIIRTLAFESGTHAQQQSPLKTETVHCAFFPRNVNYTTHLWFQVTITYITQTCVSLLRWQNVELLRKFHDTFLFNFFFFTSVLL